MTPHDLATLRGIVEAAKPNAVLMLPRAVVLALLDGFQTPAGGGTSPPEDVSLPQLALAGVRNELAGQGTFLGEGA